MPFVNPFRMVLCPFCFHRFRLRDAPTRETSATFETIPDEQIGKFLQAPPPNMGRVRKPERTLWWRLLSYIYVARLVSVGTVTNHRICPHCHLNLPSAVANGWLNTSIIAVVGSRNTGKSHFIPILIDQLRRRFSREVGFSIVSQESWSLQQMSRVSSSQLFNERYQRLFDETERRVLDQTSTTDSEKRIPLIYRLTFPRRGLKRLLAPFSNKIAVDLVFFDTAGEALGNPDQRDTLFRYTSHAAGILFLIDPLCFETIVADLPVGVRRVLKGVGRDWGRGAEALEEAQNLIQHFAADSPNQSIRCPAAIVLTKSDILETQMQNMGALEDSMHHGGFNVEDCRRTSAEIIAFLERKGCTELVGNAQNTFKRNAFFAVSALGCQPDDDGLIPALEPRRVADPLFWVLFQMGVMPASQQLS